MSQVRVLVGTRKGAFVLSADGKRERWKVEGPHFAGWEIYHLKGSPLEPDRLYASQSSGWFGQMIQRSNDGGATWAPVGNSIRLRRHAGHASMVRRNPAPLGVRARLAPRALARRSGYGLRRRRRRRALRDLRRRRDLARTSGPARARIRAGVAAGRGRDVSAHGPAGPRSPRPNVRRDLGSRCLPQRRCGRHAGGRSIAGSNPSAFRIPMRRSDTAFTTSRCTRRGPRSCSCRNTGTSCAATTPANRGTKSAATCRPTSVSLSTCTRTSRKRSTSFPSRATRNTFRSTASFASIRSRTGGNEWEELARGLPRTRLLRQRLARRDGGRLARFVRHLFRNDGRAGVRVGGCRRQLVADRARSSRRAFRRSPNAAVIRVVLPAHLRALVRAGGEIALDLRGRSHPAQRVGCDRSVVPRLARNDSRSVYATAASVRAFFRLPARPLARAARRSPSRRSRERCGALPHRRRDGRRLTWPTSSTNWSKMPASTRPISKGRAPSFRRATSRS